MDWIVGVLLLAVGIIIGFFIAKFFADKKLAEETAKIKDSSLQEIIAQHTADHLSETRAIVASLQTKCEDLAHQLDAYESVVNASKEQNGNEKLSYFGEHATAFIRHQQDKQKRKPTQAEFQPRDFSSGSSGLFDGSKNKQFVDKKS